MSLLLAAAAGLLSGVCVSLGIGGGFVLLLYLTAAASLPQKEAQLLNLLFFLPAALISLWLHLRNRLVDLRAALPAAVGGAAGVLLGTWASSAVSEDWLSRLFALFILWIGCRELFSRSGPKPLPPADDET